MKNVLTGKASNIRARAANILAIDDCDALAFASKRPRSDGRARAATENHQIKFFRLRLLKIMDGWRDLGAVHATFPFLANDWASRSGLEVYLLVTLPPPPSILQNIWNQQLADFDRRNSSQNLHNKYLI